MRAATGGGGDDGGIYKEGESVGGSAGEERGRERERGTLGWRERGSAALLIPPPPESFTAFSLCWLPPPNAVFMPPCLFPHSFFFLFLFVLLLKYARPSSRGHRHSRGISGHPDAAIKVGAREREEGVGGGPGVASGSKRKRINLGCRRSAPIDSYSTS